MRRAIGITLIVCSLLLMVWTVFSVWKDRKTGPENQMPQIEQQEDFRQEQQSEKEEDLVESKPEPPGALAATVSWRDTETLVISGESPDEGALVRMAVTVGDGVVGEATAQVSGYRWEAEIEIPGGLTEGMELSIVVGSGDKKRLVVIPLDG